MKKGLVVILVALTAMLMVYGLADAKVKGLCVDCHTMHNSEDSEPMAYDDSDGWSGGALSGTPEEEPIPHLLRASCIACHTSSNSDTIVTAASGSTSNRIPIVRNIVQPVNPLAGGNFYWVEATGDGYGHNIMAEDATHPGRGLTMDPTELGPGNDEYGDHCAESCHYTLYEPVRSSGNITGCQGCHFETFHHKDPGAYDGGTYMSGTALKLKNTKTVDPTYRYLTGHHYWGRISGGTIAAEPGVFVEGVEDQDNGADALEMWEQGIAVGSTAGNIYKAFDLTPWVINNTNRSTSALCAACHKIFHEEQKVVGGPYNNMWIRHPADQNMPTSGEYASYAYNTQAPVAFTNTTARTGAKVMCLSCHRPHGSPYENSLRWAYSDDELNGTSVQEAAVASSTEGCFRCHTTKDDPEP